MNLLVITLVLSCNRSCSYCPLKEWFLPATEYFNPIKNEVLLKWLDAYIDPKEWILELTGGEPGLYKEIDTLVYELDKRGYRGIIKTNGTLPIPKSKNIKLLTAWHEWQKECPNNYDCILIIQNPDDDWRGKVKYCKENNIPYQTTLLDDNETTRKYSFMFSQPVKMFKKISFMSKDGRLAGCPKSPPFEYDNIFDMTPPIVCGSLCSHCPTAKDMERYVKFLYKEE